MENVSTGYDESMILKNIDLEVGKEQVVALLGRNGVGKTTLLKTIMGILPAREGDIFVENKSVRSTPTNARARMGIGYVPQGIVSGLEGDAQAQGRRAKWRPATAVGDWARIADQSQVADL
jgi:ABC-type branched-subunit amino acid transport system ATPase component